MAHNIYNTYEEALQEIYTENTDFYTSLLQTWENKKLRGYEIFKELKNLSQEEIDKLSDTQIILLAVLRYRNGDSLFIYSQKIISPFEQRFNQIKYKNKINLDSYKNLPKKYLPYLTAYMQNQWKKNNRISRKKETVTFKPRLDDFSLSIFKKGITRPFIVLKQKL